MFDRTAHAIFNISTYSRLSDAIILMCDFQLAPGVPLNLVQYGAFLQHCTLTKWNTSTNYKHTHPRLSEDPRELLELVRPLDRPLIEELLLAVECGHESDMFSNMDAITHPTFVVAPNSYLTDSCAPLERWLKRSIACLVTLNKAAHSQAGLRDQFPPCCRWRSASLRPC